MDKQKIKNSIADIEYDNFSIGNCGIGIKVINLRERREKYLADIIIIDDNVRTRYNDCEYPKNIITV